MRIAHGDGAELDGRDPRPRAGSGHARSGARNGSAAGRKSGTPRSTLTSVAGLDARCDCARGAHELELVAQARRQIARQAAHAVAALLDLAAVGVEDCGSSHRRPSAMLAVDEQQLIEADAAAPIAPSGVRPRARGGTCLLGHGNDHEVVAEAVHFGESELHRSCEGRIAAQMARPAPRKARILGQKIARQDDRGLRLAQTATLVQGSARIPRPSREPRRAQDDRRARQPGARAHGDLAPRAREARARSYVHRRELARHSRAQQPVRHRGPRRGRDRPRQPRGADGARPAARRAARAATAAQRRRSVARAAAPQRNPEHGAENRPQRAVPGGRRRRRGRRSCRLADPNLLARRRRAADHLGAHDDARAAPRAAEPGDLPPAGHRPQQDHHALARAPRRRYRLPGVLRQASRRAVSGRREPGRRPGDDPRGGDADSEHVVGVRVRGSAARRALRGRQVHGLRAARPRDGRDHARGLHLTRAKRRSKVRSATTRAITTRPSAFRS